MEKIALRVAVFFLMVSVAASANSPKTKRRQEINFEGEVVEGVARQPLDSVSQLAERASRRHQSLYDKRENFTERNKEKLKELLETY